SLVNAEAAAMNNLATASQRASIASSAAVGAKNLLSGALGLKQIMLAYRC
ncbi:hypothetical protein HPSH465_1587, partial [Glaesserella parasuis H465]